MWEKWEELKKNVRGGRLRKRPYFAHPGALRLATLPTLLLTDRMKQCLWPSCKTLMTQFKRHHRTRGQLFAGTGSICWLKWQWQQLKTPGTRSSMCCDERIIFFFQLDLLPIVLFLLHYVQCPICVFVCVH